MLEEIIDQSIKENEVVLFISLNIEKSKIIKIIIIFITISSLLLCSYDHTVY